MNKKCSKCKESFPLSDFGKRKDSLDGYTGICKKCIAKRAMQRRKGKLDVELFEFRYRFDKRKELLKINKSICSNCNTEYDLSFSHSNTYCSDCTKKIYKNKYELNKDKYLLQKKEYYKDNIEIITKNRADKYRENPEYQKTYQKTYGIKWDIKNKHKRQAITRKYQIAKINAVPPWITKKMLIDIDNFYKESIRLTKETGIMHHVDHIIPLQGKFVCGLHVPWNLQVLTMSENCSKSNKIQNI